jgi:hypothetical protein
MPSNERVRLHDGEDATPVDQPRQRDECDAGRVISPPWLNLPLQVQRQLLAKKQILGGELDVRPQQRRHESDDVASDARDRAYVELRTGLCHAVGCYCRRTLVRIDRHEDTSDDLFSAAPVGRRELGPNSFRSTFCGPQLSGLNALAFIGHSAEVLLFGEQEYQSAGFKMYMPPTGPQPGGKYYVVHGDACPTVNPSPMCSMGIVLPDRLPFNGQIMFFGQCKAGNIFRNMLGVPDESDSGPAMIVPKLPNVDTDLDAGAYAWKYILGALMAGENVTRAVEIANQRLGDGDPFDGQYFTVRFKVVGNTNASFK